MGVVWPRFVVDRFTPNQDLRRARDGKKGLRANVGVLVKSRKRRAKYEIVGLAVGTTVGTLG